MVRIHTALFRAANTKKNERREKYGRKKDERNCKMV